VPALPSITLKDRHTVAALRHIIIFVHTATGVAAEFPFHVEKYGLAALLK